MAHTYICVYIHMYVHTHACMIQPPNECLWLTYNALIAEETFEEEEGIWKSLLLQLKKDPKITVETALKV